MPQNSHLELLGRGETKTGQPREGVYDRDAVAARAAECARSLVWLPGVKTSRQFAERLRNVREKLELVLAHIEAGPESDAEPLLTEDDIRLLRSQAAKLRASEKALTQLPHVSSSTREISPRALVLAKDLLASSDYRFSDSGFRDYMQAFQGVVVLKLAELNAMAPCLQLVLLERIAALAEQHAAKQIAEPVTACIRSLRELELAPWKELLEPLIVFDQVLRQDPAGAYARMEAESRELYRNAVVKLAEHSGFSEVEVAETALALARESLRHPEGNARAAARHSHIGYYLIAEGNRELCRRAHVRLPWHDRIEVVLRRFADEFYIVGIELLTLLITIAIIWRGIDRYSLSSIFFAALVLLLPASQSAVEVMNYLVTSLLRPRILPKLDFRKGIPDDCLTMVVVPTLLLDEKQARKLVNDLEVRYVGNLSRNLHFALLTDLPDSAEQPREDNPLVELCGQLIRDLNNKYAGNGAGSFAMFHRHRVFNPREGAWMGWERKRGKLLDFSKLILADYDSFPYKIGDLSLLPRIRYVLTLDVDTELPRGTAARLIGTLAHPLSQAIIDPERNVVVEGFGILQPRVGISVESAAQSRLASIYSGQTGFDIYTRAVSDVYQDLYGEGSFTGKGLYEVRTLHKVLDHRFPRNALLSHDLIEGAYGRAGLVSDIEVVDHYPSHYGAYSRRKHRWLRGDWQVAEWLFPLVPDESGRRVRNPISVISRWKILDNLRRSLVEPATLVLLVLGWTVLPGSPLYWTLVTLAILFVPPWVEFAFGICRGVLAGSLTAIGDALRALATASTSILLTFTFLLHNALIATDAIWRTLYRRMVSRRRLLEWETAAEAESSKHKRTLVDLYLISTPFVATLIGLAVAWGRRPAIWAALPILALWAGSKLVSLWLDRSPLPARNQASEKDELFLRRTALHTWRYFAEFSTEEHNWLLPDNVQETPPKLAARISPTNLGFLLNARQAACDFGYLTIPEFVQLTGRTLQAMSRMETYRGHLLNWYQTRTLQAEKPRFLSTVDSGNLAASLLTLKGGCAALLGKPLLSPSLLQGYDDHVRVLIDLRMLSRHSVKAWRRHQKLPWLQRLLVPAPEVWNSRKAIERQKNGDGTNTATEQWFADQLHARGEAAQKVTAEFMPWLLPEFESLRNNEKSADQITVLQLPGQIAAWRTKLWQATSNVVMSDNLRLDCVRLERLLERAHANALQLIRDLRGLESAAEHWIANMDFAFLLERRRNMLSIGFDVETGTLHRACYDLLASESRIASFVAIAKGDIPQEVWFLLQRSQVEAEGLPTLLSWTGTMFEYLMPGIWMRSYPSTLLRRTTEGAVRAQQAYAAAKRIPWGISESSFYELDTSGSYGYRAFGVPQLALQQEETPRLVVAPYATAMAIGVDTAAALKNLRRMVKYGWLGGLGFYEAADFTAAPRGFRRKRFLVVKSWMAHHQGMILLSLTNFLDADVVQSWFHADPRVQATELLLQERSGRHISFVQQTRPSAQRLKNGQTAAKKLALAN